jgi:para-nitrobenzyl esterase
MQLNPVLLSDAPDFGGRVIWTHPMSEDCLNLNIWTSACDDGRRPVMLWLHGGAFLDGMGYSTWTDGTRLASDHDVVVVSINHRLGVFGFLHLADSEETDFADSGNVGMLDIVAALEWVRDNVARFGGDPANVTVFGGSGGGWKISTLMAMPAAAGLFHKAIVQSGSYLHANSADLGERVSREVLRRLGISPNRVDRLREVPAAAILDAVKGAPLPGAMERRMDFAPTVDGQALRRDPFDPDAPPGASGIPMMIGTTRHEALAEWAPDDDDDALVARLGRHGLSPDRTRELIDLYARARPGLSRPDVLADIRGDIGFRFPAVLQAERHSATGSPVYMYLFTWPWEAMGNRAVHGLELPFAFGVASEETLSTPVDENARALAAEMSAAWAAFARSGDPVHPGLPRWDRYSIERRSTMIFGPERFIEVDPMGADRIAWFEALDDASSTTDVAR